MPSASIGTIMKVNVLGAGIIGITSAYQLAKAGYEVTVIDRQGGPALETSFANANGSLVRLLLAWAAPASRRKAIKRGFSWNMPSYSCGGQGLTAPCSPG